jgi:hypothetical protein
VHQASALALPFTADTFDVMWMQNVGMNIVDNNLIASKAMHTLLGECELDVKTLEEASDMILNSPPPVSSAPVSPIPQPQLGLSVFVDNLSEKAMNARRSIQEGQTRFVRGIFLAQ